MFLSVRRRVTWCNVFWIRGGPRIRGVGRSERGLLRPPFWGASFQFPILHGEVVLYWSKAKSAENSEISDRPTGSIACADLLHTFGVQLPWCFTVSWGVAGLHGHWLSFAWSQPQVCLNDDSQLHHRAVSLTSAIVLSHHIPMRWLWFVLKSLLTEHRASWSNTGLVTVTLRLYL